MAAAKHTLTFLRLLPEKPHPTETPMPVRSQTPVLPPLSGVDVPEPTADVPDRVDSGKDLVGVRDLARFGVMELTPQERKWDWEGRQKGLIQGHENVIARYEQQSQRLRLL